LRHRGTLSACGDRLYMKYLLIEGITFTLCFGHIHGDRSERKNIKCSRISGFSAGDLR